MLPLAAPADVDVPVRWFGFAAVKAAITVQWQEFGQMLMLMSALAHIIFMSLFGGFLLVMRNAGEQENGDMSKVRLGPKGCWRCAQGHAGCRAMELTSGAHGQ